MKQGQRLNQFSIADTDQIKELCAVRGMTDLQIVMWFKRYFKRDITIEEVQRICAECGRNCRIDKRS